MFCYVELLSSLCHIFEQTSFLHPSLEPPSSHRFNLQQPNSRSSLGTLNYLSPSLDLLTYLTPSQL